MAITFISLPHFGPTRACGIDVDLLAVGERLKARIVCVRQHGAFGPSSPLSVMRTVGIGG